MSVTGRVVSLEPTTLLHLTELERVTLQQLALAKLQALNLGCTIRIPAEQASGGCQKKRRPYLLKRKALTTGFFDSKKDEGKEGSEGGLVFGLPLTKCLENERTRTREAAEKAAAAAAAAAATTAALGGSGGSGGEESGEPASRKSSHASFSSLLEGAKQSSTGSLESLNLERKRPSLVVGGGGGDLLLPSTPGPTSPDLLMVESGPQIPGLVNTCLRHLEGTGMRTLGIFRVSSSKKRVRQLREEFDSGREVWLTEDHCPHDVATLLKEFFRDLPEPLLTRDLYYPLIKTQKIRNRKLQFEALQHLVQLMPSANRDTLYSLLIFLATVADRSEDAIAPSGETLQGNRMDSSNLATLFAPNILHMVKPGAEQPSAATLATGAEERIEVINVVRTMIDHNKELFEVPTELLDETYQHLMDTHPEALDILLRRRCTAPDQLDLEADTGSSVFEGSECSSSLPRSPTDATHHHDFDRARVEEVLNEGGRVRRRREEVVHEAAAVAVPQQSGRRRRSGEEEEDSRGRRGEKGSEGGGGEERGWWRRREKSLSREFDERPAEKTRWFRKRDKSGVRSSRGSRGEDGSGRARLSTDKSDGAGEDEEGWSEIGPGRLRVPEPTVRRLSSPEIDSSGVITASLRIPVPLSQQTPISLAPPPQTSVAPSASQDPSIPFIEDGTEKKHRQRKTAQQSSGTVRGEAGRQRSGSSDSYLGQPITGTMSFQPLSKKGGDKRSHDSVLSSSSADVFTLSPSPRNTPLSDQYPSGTSSPLSRPGSPPSWLSPDSGTPGLSPPNSPPLQPRRRGGETRPSPITHSITHTFGSSRPTSVSSKSKTSSTGSGVTQGIFPIGRSRTVDSFRVETGQGDTWTSGSGAGNGATGSGRRSSRGEDGGGKGEGGSSAMKRYTRRRYTGERHPTGHLPDLPPHPQTDTQTHTEGQTQLWKRWEIIASDPTEPETFV
ncbi:hypothetical protein Pmani_036952 [Petrolisthes manimaculis]|uniref:Rho-GAP domain-containing protein n=1 Tax=Petrolisthes manimaculis TaxID=1843537 RepID=A0AAE1TLM9_9EUCA|nr:hypothetical protein Pmani_036952 [Petrolisthes manimaculis]